MAEKYAFGILSLATLLVGFIYFTNNLTTGQLDYQGNAIALDTIKTLSSDKATILVEGTRSTLIDINTGQELTKTELQERGIIILTNKAYNRRGNVLGQEELELYGILALQD